MGLGTIAAVGNVLDLPGSSVRDVLMGRNPFDQWLSPTSFKNRTYGRELVEKLGGRRNRETGIWGWKNDPEEMALDLGGFALEVILDPLGPLAKPFGVVSKIASGVKLGGNLAGKGIRRLPGGVRAMDALASTKVAARRLFDRRVAGAATAERQRAFGEGYESLLKEEDLVNEHAVDTISQLHKMGIEQDSATGFNSLMRVLEDTDQWRQNTTLVDDTIEALDAAGNPLGQGVVREVVTDADQISKYVVDLNTPGGVVRQTLDDGTFRKVATDPTVEFLPPEAKATLARWFEGEGINKYVLDRARAVGQRTPELEDMADIRYAARQMSAFLKKTVFDEQGRIRGPAANHWSQDPELYRQMLYKDFKGGTPVVNHVLNDKRWNEMVDKIKDDNPLPPDASGTAMFGPQWVTWKHLEGFAKSIDTTVDDLWEELGFDLTRPYASLPEVETALTKFRAQMASAAQSGNAVVRVKKAGMGRSLFDPLTNGAGTRAVRIDPATGDFGLPAWADVQRLDLDDPTNFKEVLDSMHGGDPLLFNKAMDDLTELRRQGRRVFSWMEDNPNSWRPIRNYFTPTVESTFEKGFKTRLGNLRDTVAKQAISESEVVAKALEAGVRKYHGHVVMKDMAHVKEGKFVFTDTLTGTKREVPIGEYTTMRNELEASKQLGMPVDNFAARVEAGEFVQQMDNRYEHLGWMLEARPNVRDYTMFGNNPILNAADMAKARLKSAWVDEQMRVMVKEHVLRDAITDPKTGQMKLSVQRTASGSASGAKYARPDGDVGATLDTLLQARQKTLDPKRFLRLLADDLEAAGVSVKQIDEADLFNHLRQTRLDPAQVEDVTNLFKYFEPQPEINSLLRGIDSTMTVFKGNVLGTPSTVFRNIMSGALNLWFMGDATGKAGLQSMVDGFQLARGKVADIPLTPDMESFIRMSGKDPNNVADRAAAFVSRFIGKSNRTSANAHLDTLDVVGMENAGKATRVLENMPRSGAEHIASLKTFWKSQGTLDHFNPVNVPGVMKWDPVQEKWVSRSTQHVGSYITGHMQAFGDNAVRMAGVLGNMRKGMSFDDAFAKVAWNQINYDARNFTRFERSVMKRIFPFYAFMSRSLPMVAMELATNPGGGLGRVIRAQRMGVQGEAEYVPSEIQDTAAIRLSPGADGQMRYLTSLGLMHEDALRYLAPTQGVRGLLQNVIGSSNPITKGAVEYATNTSTFFEGPMGGRRLDDLDPKLGRIVHNIRLQASKYGIGSEPVLPPSGRPNPVGGPLVEAAVANSPLASYLRYVHVTLDPRRSTKDKLINLLTGVRTKEFSDEAMVREIRDRMNALQIKYGARPVTIVAGIDGLKQEMLDQGMKTEADQLERIGKVLTELRKRTALAKQKKKP